MKKRLTAFLAMTLAFMSVLGASDARIIDAKIVTEVLEWGETVTGVRLEYSEEIKGTSIQRNGDTLQPLTYLVPGERTIDAVYVNSSGKKGEASPYGRYVFLDFYIGPDWTHYLDYPAYTGKNRPESAKISIYQVEPVETRDGETVAPSGRIVTSGEIRIGIDEFTSFLYTGDLGVEGVPFYFHLYIPEGYEEKKEGLEVLPLILHFPSADATYTDYSGIYYGALVSHNDAAVWVTPEAQEEHPAFVLSYGTPERPENQVISQIFIEEVRYLLGKYNIDASRIYAISLAGGSKSLIPVIFSEPGLIAGAIIICYDFQEDYPALEAKEKFRKLFESIPVWLIVSEDDYTGKVAGDPRTKAERMLSTMEELNEEGVTVAVESAWNGFIRGKKAEKQAEALIAKAEALGTDDLFSVFLANTIHVNGHAAWTAVYSNDAIRGWLFEQANDEAYTPGN